MWKAAAAQLPESPTTKSAFSLPNLCVCLKKDEEKKKHIFSVKDCLFPVEGAELRCWIVSNRFYYVRMDVTVRLEMKTRTRNVTLCQTLTPGCTSPKIKMVK